MWYNQLSMRQSVLYVEKGGRKVGRYYTKESKEGGYQKSREQRTQHQQKERIDISYIARR